MKTKYNGVITIVDKKKLEDVISDTIKKHIVNDPEEPYNDKEALIEEIMEIYDGIYSEVDENIPVDTKVIRSTIFQDGCSKLTNDKCIRRVYLELKDTGIVL